MSIDIDAIEARAADATPGPWHYRWHPDGLGLWIQPEGEDSFSIGPNDNDENNAAFIAAARQDVPALCAEVRELRAALGRLQGEVETIINTEPHEDVCLVTRGGDCTCWQARLQTALDGDK